MSAVEDRLKEMNLTLPPTPSAVGAYVPFVRSGSLVFIAGQGPWRSGKALAAGKLGAEFTVETSAEAVRAATLNALAVMKAAVGDLDKVARVVKVTGYVACAAGFTETPAVLNHASNLLLAAFGEKGRHARVAVGVAELPFGTPVELEIVIEVAG